MDNGFRLEEFLPFRLNMVAQEVSERLSRIYAETFGVDIPQWRILANLASRGQITAQGIAQITMSHKSTISRAVQQLEDRNLVVRGVSNADKRSYALQLTSEGKRLFKQMLPPVLAFERELMASMSKTEGRALLKGISALEGSLRSSRKDRP